MKLGPLPLLKVREVDQFSQDGEEFGQHIKVEIFLFDTGAFIDSAPQQAQVLQNLVPYGPVLEHHYPVALSDSITTLELPHHSMSQLLGATHLLQIHLQVVAGLLSISSLLLQL
jgi:hypothetical protein